MIILENDPIATNVATISISGATSNLDSSDQYYYYPYSYTEALAGLMVNTSNGHLYLSEGYAFSTSVFVQNDGNIVVSSGASATLQVRHGTTVATARLPRPTRRSTCSAAGRTMAPSRRRFDGEPGEPGQHFANRSFRPWLRLDHSESDRLLRRLHRLLGRRLHG